MNVKAFVAAVAVGLSAGAGVAAEVPLKAVDLSVKGAIEGENITFTVSFTVEMKRGGRELPLVTGDLVLEGVAEPKTDSQIRYDPETSTYYMRFGRGGKHKVTATFAARPRIVGEGPWREAAFAIPASRVRELEVACDRSDLEVLFPGAMRLERTVADETLTVKAVLGPGRPFTVRWKPQVREMDAALVLASEANTVATASAGALRVDTLFVFEISQGKMREVSFSVPKALSVTQVRGGHIRDWRVTDEGGATKLTVVLARPQTKQYAVQIQSEMALTDFPVQIDMPVIKPEGGIRSSGSVAIGTDSAIRLVVEKTGGLSQKNSSEFPRIILDRKHPRPLPKSNAFFYSYAATPYQMKLSLDDIVPSYDANEQMVVSLREDDLTVDAAVDLDVRDAPIRRLVVEVPGGFLVSSVKGSQVEDHRVHEQGEGETQQVEIHFRRPVLGHTLIRMRLELGKSPVGADQRVWGISVPGAKNERGSLVVVADRGVQLETPESEGLREVHVSSVPIRVANAQFAYRFRERGWSLRLLAREKPAGIRAEAFHLISIGEGVVYGSVVVNYFISGAPVDELYFRIPEGLQNVEFVGSDVQRWVKEGSLLKVKLQRKITGDYNIGLTHSQRYEAGSKILVGGVECARVETQTGYICIASHLNLKLEPKGKPDANLLAIDRSEVPSNYRLLINAPVMGTYKYVNTPHSVSMGVAAYGRTGLLPVVIEIMEIETRLAVGEKRQTESVTRIHYKIKNSSSQFLTLEMPEGAAVWSTHIVDRKTGQRRRVTSSYDKTAGLLKIPLRRHRNPNEPVTVELEYGQTHGRFAWRGGLDLSAPRSAIRSTYAHWTLKAPQDWAVLPRGGNGNMVPEARDVRQGRPSLVMRGVLSSWGWSLGRLFASHWGTVIGVALAVLLGMALAFRRSAIPVLVLGAAVSLVLVAGILAAAAPGFERNFVSRENLATLSFIQTLSLDKEAPLVISASVVPAWRRYAGFGSLVLVPVLVLVAFSLALIARFRAAERHKAGILLIALGAIGLLYSAARVPAASLVMGHLLTWGLPALLAVYVLVRCSLGMRRLATATALMLLGCLLTSGCRPSGRPPPPLKTDTTILERVECILAAERDSMQIDLRLSINTAVALRFPVADQSAILLSPERVSEQVRVEEADGKYYLHVLRKGRYDVALKLLSPLAKAGEDGLRLFRMPLPAALTNRVELTVPETGMKIEAPTAVRLNREETENSTIARAILGPEDPVFFIWKPRTRQTELEKTAFFADVTSLFRFDAGLAEGRHGLRFQIAQGELKAIRLRVPKKATVTAVEGKGLGAWRFDPAKGELEARLATGVSGDYEMTVVTQVSSEGLPATVLVGTIEVLGAVRQRGTIGLTTDPSVYVTVGKHPHKMSVDDFARESAELLSAVQGLKSTDIRQAYRTGRPGEVLEVEVHEVKPEIRVHEVASFWVGDERLVYDTGTKGGLAITVAKAGVFSVSMKLPEGYDIDALRAPQVSHWDENAEGDVRAVQVHFKQKLFGTVLVKLALSRSVADLPKSLALPRIQVEGALKHTGQITVSAARGIRLSEAERKGVSNIDPLELGSRRQGVLIYKLLKPEWKLLLKTEVVEPRVNVEFLHVAKVTEGLIRHTHYLRYRLHNAGAKVFEVDVPKEAIGLLITGSQIAHSSEISPGRWRVELTKKKFDQPYLLTVRYETRFDRSAGEVRLAPVGAAGVDLQRGHIVVYATDRVELAELSMGEMLQAAEARNISGKFGAGDLSSAAFCYASTTPGYELSLRAKRHEAAPVLEAEVLETTLTTVLSEHGENMNHVRMQLRVGGKRNLETLLPAGARIWSLMVNGRSTPPSERSDRVKGKVLLIPLPQTPSGEVIADVEFVYVVSRDRALADGGQEFPGPQFDLPLKKLKWRFYLPESYDYDDFRGTLAVNEDVLRRGGLRRYDLRRYEEEVDETQRAQRRKVDYFQDQGKVLAKKGFQYKARYAFANAYNHSFSDPAQNEDARVQLHNLIREQAVVGLVGRRGHLRPRTGLGGEPSAQAAPAQDLGDQFNQAEAERLRSSLSKTDSDNLEHITRSIIETQESAAGAAVQIAVSMPLRGQIVEFDRPVQVKPNSDMRVSFDADPIVPPNVKKDWAWMAGLFACLFLVLLARPGVERKWSELRRRLKEREAESVAEANRAPEALDPEEDMNASYPREQGENALESPDEEPGMFEDPSDRV